MMRAASRQLCLTWQINTWNIKWWTSHLMFGYIEKICSPEKLESETQPINMINMVLAYLIGYPSIFAGFILHSLIQSARNWWVHHLSLALPLADRRRPHHGPTVGSWSQLTYSSGVGRHNGSETMAIPKSVQIGMLDGHGSKLANH